MHQQLPPIQHPDKAWSLLRSFAAGDRSRGEDYFRHGHVVSLTCVTPGTHYLAMVSGTTVYTVDLEYCVQAWVD